MKVQPVSFYLKKTKARRTGEYLYKEGTHSVTYTPRVLTSQAEILLCVGLVEFMSIKQIAKLLGYSTPVVSRAIRYYYGKF